MFQLFGANAIINRMKKNVLRKTNKSLSIITLCSMLNLTVIAVIHAQVQENNSDARTVTILAVNDMHSAMDLFPQFAAIVDSVRAVQPNLLLFSAGDNRTGNPVNDRYEIPGYPLVDLMNRIGFDASAVGNHEFDADIKGFRDLIGFSDFRYLCANLDAHDSLRLHTVPYRFFERNGIRIGVLGLIQLGPHGIPDSHPDNVKGINFRPALEVVHDYLWIREQSDVFILLSHLGNNDDLLLADTFPEADIIIGGHSHTVVPNRVLRNGILVTQSGSSLRYVTELNIEVSGRRVTNKSHKLIDVNSTSLIDNEIKEVVDVYNNNETLNIVLTQAVTPFDTNEELGCMMADAQRAETNSDIAVVNYGGVRYSTHAAGDFLMRDAFSLDPFNNSLIIFEMTGRDIQEMLIASCEIREYPFVSGITYNVSFKEDWSVEKLAVFLPNGKPIDPRTTYRVSINSYLASVCPFTKDLTGIDTFIGATNALVEYLKKQITIDYQGVKRVRN